MNLLDSIVGWTIASVYILFLLGMGGVCAAIIIAFLLDTIQGKGAGKGSCGPRKEFPYEDDWIIPILMVRDMQDGHFDGDIYQGGSHHH